MVDVEISDENQAPRKSKTLIFISLFISLVLGGSAFYVISSGMISLPESHTRTADTEHGDPSGTSDSVAFVALDPILITFGTGRDRTHLRFRTQLEVPKSAVHEVEQLIPRVIDIFNTFLRALTLDELQEPSALTKLRAQMLRRARIVLGEDNINDVLVMEFVLD